MARAYFAWPIIQFRYVNYENYNPNGFQRNGKTLTQKPAKTDGNRATNIIVLTSKRVLSTQDSRTVDFVGLGTPQTPKSKFLGAQNEMGPI